MEDILAQLMVVLYYIRNIVYFFVGGIVFIVVLCMEPVTKRMDNLLWYAICCLVLWCWIFSKVIVL